MYSWLCVSEKRGVTTPRLWPTQKFWRYNHPCGANNTACSNDDVRVLCLHADCITSAKEFMFYLAFVCLSVCLLANFTQNNLSYLHENFAKDISLERKFPLNLGSHPESDSGSRLRIWTLDPDRICLGGGLRSPSALVSDILFRRRLRCVYRYKKQREVFVTFIADFVINNIAV